MSKDLFLMMREQEVNTNKFLPTKKELKASSESFADELINSGDYDIIELYSQASRLKETITALEGRLKKQLPPEGFESFGLKASYSNGGYTLDYSKDDIHSKLTAKLKDREVLLKTADKSKDIIFDSDGVEIPRLPHNDRASSMKVSF